MKISFPLFLSAISLLSSLTQAQARVINGTEVEIDRYNYTVALENLLGDFYCGGTLIAPEYVMTVSYCYTAKKAIIGRHDFSDSSEEFEEIEIEYAVTHPDYDDWTLENAITIFKLKEESSYTPVTLSTGSGNTTSPGTDVTLIGWGAVDTEDDEYPLSDVLREGTAKIISNEECAEAYSEEGWSVTDDMMCAAKDGKDIACFGDGGSPLIIKGSDALADVQVGIMSWGAEECDVEGKPGVYVKVDEFTDFIGCVTDGGSDECGSTFDSSSIFSFVDLFPEMIQGLVFELYLIVSPLFQFL